MIRKVGFSENKEAWDVAHEIVIHPKPPHGVVRSRVNAHGLLVGIFPGDSLIHIEQIAVFFFDRVLTHSLDGICKIQKNAIAGRSNSKTRVACFLGCSRGNVARSQITKTGIFSFEKIVTLSLRDIPRFALIALLFGNPNTTIIAQ